MALINFKGDEKYNNNFIMCLEVMNLYSETLHKAGLHSSVRLHLLAGLDLVGPVPGPFQTSLPPFQAIPSLQPQLKNQINGRVVSSKRDFIAYKPKIFTIWFLQAEFCPSKFYILKP